MSKRNAPDDFDADQGEHPPAKVHVGNLKAHQDFNPPPSPSIVAAIGPEPRASHPARHQRNRSDTEILGASTHGKVFGVLRDQATTTRQSQTSQTTSKPADDHLAGFRFNGRFMLLDALFTNNDLTLYWTTTFLEPKELIKLYSIHKTFNWLVNSHYTSFVYSAARAWCWLTPDKVGADENVNLNPSVTGNLRSTSFRNKAYEGQVYVSSDVSLEERREIRAELVQHLTKRPPPPFEPLSDSITIINLLPFTSYLHLCIRDPAKRPKPAHGHPSTTSITLESAGIIQVPEDKLQNHSGSRFVPSFKYLQMLYARAKYARSIVRTLVHDHGLPLPPTTPISLIKMSLLMDIPTNASRIALMHSTKYWTNRDLYNLQTLFIKLDVCFTHPISSKGYVAKHMRRMLLAQRSIGVLARVLRREQCQTKLDTALLWARWRGQVGRDNQNGKILGVPAREIGRLEYERWGQAALLPDPQNSGRMRLVDWRSQWIGDWPGQKMLRPDQLVLREAAKRDLRFGHLFYRMLLEGTYDPKTWGPVEQEPYEPDERVLELEKELAELRLEGERKLNIILQKRDANAKRKGKRKASVAASPSVDDEGDVEMEL